MTGKDKEEQIKTWKDGEVEGPAGTVELDDSELENAAGGAELAPDTCECCPTEGNGTCEMDTSGCC